MPDIAAVHDSIQNRSDFFERSRMMPLSHTGMTDIYTAKVQGMRRYRVCSLALHLLRLISIPTWLWYQMCTALMLLARLLGPFSALYPVSQYIIVLS